MQLYILSRFDTLKLVVEALLPAQTLVTGNYSFLFDSIDVATEPLTAVVRGDWLNISRWQTDAVISRRWSHEQHIGDSAIA